MHQRHILSSGYFDYYHQPNQAYYAIDLSSNNANVVAAKLGTVVSIKGGSSSGYGYKCANSRDNCIVLDNGNGLFTEYREFTTNAINPITGQAFKIGDTVAAGATLGTLSGGHLHFQIMTFSPAGVFDSKSTNTALANVTVGGKLLADYKLGGNFQVAQSGSTYTVTGGTPIHTTIYGTLSASPVSFGGNNTINSTVSGSTATMKEGSPAYIWTDWKVPLDAKFLSFEFFWNDLGDGDFLSMYFGDTLLFTFLGTDFLGNEFLSSGLIWIGQFAGQTDQLLFALDSVGNPNADIRLRNLTLYSEATVPEPNTLALLAIGLIGLAGAKRIKWGRTRKALA